MVFFNSIYFIDYKKYPVQNEISLVGFYDCHNATISTVHLQSSFYIANITCLLVRNKKNELLRSGGFDF
jgi:hypothetical protein